MTRVSSSELVKPSTLSRLSDVVLPLAHLRVCFVRCVHGACLIHKQCAFGNHPGLLAVTI